jgi:hypothetical protein
MTAGSGLFDRYHQPLSLLADAAAARPDRALRPLAGGAHSFDTMLEGPVLTTGTNTVKTFGDRERLTVKGAEVKATFADGTPALTECAVKRGRILRFACFPGISYARSGLAAGWRELMAVMLLNWSGSVQSNVTVVVRSEREPARVVSARKGALKGDFKAVANGPFKFETVTTVDLDGVDVLSVYGR